MERLALLMVFLLLPAMAQALTVDEIIRLKQAGVAASTIELLIEKNAVRTKRAGIVQQNGWTVYTTDTREAQSLPVEDYGTAYPIQVYPQVGGGRRR